VRSRMSQTHQLRFRELPCEIVEIEPLRLTLFIKRDHQISNGLSFHSASLGVAKLFSVLLYAAPSQPASPAAPTLSVAS